VLLFFLDSRVKICIRFSSLSFKAKSELCIFNVYTYMHVYIQDGSNMTGTDLCVNKPHKSLSYLNHLVYICNLTNELKNFKQNRSLL
jgi:hypothetical protein